MERHRRTATRLTWSAVARSSAVALVALASLLACVEAHAQPILVRDIDTGETSHEFFRYGFWKFDDVLFFDAVRQQTGLELWKTDGTVEGTKLVRDIVPGWGWGRVPTLIEEASDVVPFGDRGYFLATTPNSGLGLWRTDGTEDGTDLVKSFGPSFLWPTAWSPVVMGGHLYFSVKDEITFSRLWKSDGTTSGTVPVTGGLEPAFLTSVTDRLFFVRRGSSTSQLWTSDGTEAGTRSIHEVKTDGSAGSTSIRQLVNINGRLFFFQTGASTAELWTSDGTSAGTIPVADLGGSLMLVRPLSVNSLLYFPTRSPERLWRSDGTPAGTFPLLSSPDGPVSFLGGYGQFMGSVYFTAGSSSLPELWVTDGTEAGTRRVKTRVRGSDFAELGDLLIFSGPDGLWRTDGTGAGTVKFAEVSGSNLQAIGDLIVFSTGNNSPIGPAERDVWRTDGTTSGTFPLTTNEESSSSNPSRLIPTENRVVFRVERFGEMWATDGTTPRTSSIFASAFVGISELVAYGGDVWFNAGNLYRSDGTSSGTTVVENPSGGSSDLIPLRAWNGTLLLRSPDHKFWIIRSGTSLPELLHDGLDVVEFPIGSTSGRIAFIASDSESDGVEIWTTDGTTAGTRSLADHIGSASPIDETLVAATDRFFFYLDFTESGVRLWRSDETLAGTIVMHTFGGSPLHKTLPLEYGTRGATLLFGALDGVEGNELWRSDGTPEGTVLVRDIMPGPYSSRPRAFRECGPQTYFVADTESEGTELWVTDGTYEGTRLVLDLMTGRLSSDPDDLLCVGRHLYFSAAGDGVGRELWITDGTTVGTKLAAEVVPGKESSSPSDLAFAGNAILFAATTAELGRELWRVDVPVGHPRFTPTAHFSNETGGTLSLDVLREGGEIGPLTIEYFTMDGTAMAGSDYLSTSGRLEWSADDDEKKSISVPIIADDIMEGDEHFTITLRVVGVSPAVEDVLTVTIADVTPAGVIELDADSYALHRAAGNVVVTVLRNGGSTGAASVHYATESGTALAGADFTPVAGDLAWNAGDASPRTITIPIQWNGASLEGTFTIRLTSATGAGLGATRSAAVTILAAPATTSVPAMSGPMMLMLIALLSMAGVLVLRRG